MARLPIPGSDSGVWGEVLNEYLSQVHAADGTLKANAVNSAALQDGSVSGTKIADNSLTPAKLSSDTPVNGEVLSYSNGTFVWVTPSASGGSGESNTASNVGTGGVGVYKQKTGVDLEFKRLRAASTKLTISDNVANDTVDLDVDTGALGLTKSDVGLANVDNTSDANKPVSSATQSALDLKANQTHTHGAADITSGTIATARLGSGAASNTTFLRGDGTWATPAGGGGSGTAGVLTVASSEAPQALKDAADYVCTGTNDQTVINQALLRASRAADGFGGEGYIGVHLVGPTFYVGNDGLTSITMYPSTHLFGSGPGTLIRPMWPTNVDRGAIELVNNTTAHVRVSNLSIGRPTAVNFNGSGIKFEGTGTGDAYELKTANDPYCVIDHVMVLFPNRKGIYVYGASGGQREAQISHCILWNAAEEGLLISGSSDCQVSDCRANGGGAYPRFSIGGGNTKVANCKAYYSGGSSSQNADGFLISSSRCEIVGCSAQDNGRWGYNIQSASANISACTADSNSRLQADGGGFSIASNCSVQGLVAFDRGQTPASPQLRGVVFSANPQVNVTGYVSVPSGTSEVVGSVDPNSFVRIVRNNTTTFAVG